MAIGAKFIDVIPSSVENAADVKKEDVKNYLFVGIPMSEFIGKKHEFEGYIFMCLQGVTGGVELGGDIAIAVLRPVRPATGPASYHWWISRNISIIELMWFYYSEEELLR